MKPPSQTWKAFLENHVDTTVSIDFFTAPTIRSQGLYVQDGIFGGDFSKQVASFGNGGGARGAPDRQGNELTWNASSARFATSVGGAA